MRNGRRQLLSGSWERRMGALSVIFGGALVGCAILPLPSSAAGIYASGSTGFDVSYPNCSAAPPSGYSFAIVGLGGGRPFTVNSCVGSEWSTAESATSSTPSLYFNTGYAGAYGRNITGGCQSAVATAGVFGSLKGHSLSQAEQAWEIGCSEASFAASHEPAGAPAVWWADIETGNSWSSNKALNQFTVDGITSEMEALGGGGIYSSPSMWAAITGSSDWQPSPPASGAWVSGGSCSTATAFASTSTWLVQSGTTVTGVDADLAC